MYVNTAQSFALTKKLVAAKEPLFAAKAQLANDVKVKIVEAANQASCLQMHDAFLSEMYQANNKIITLSTFRRIL